MCAREPLLLPTFWLEYYYSPTTQCRSKSVSAKSLPKTGISGNLAGDFRQFLAKVAAIRSLETELDARESPILQAFRDYGVIYLRLTDWLAEVEGIEPPNGDSKVEH